MAKYAAQGVPVTLITCTLGELGEIIPAELVHLADGRGDRLGEYRRAELAAACTALGVSDHRFLGGPGRGRDAGQGGPPAHNPPRHCSPDGAAPERPPPASGLPRRPPAGVVAPPPG